MVFAAAGIGTQTGHTFGISRVVGLPRDDAEFGCRMLQARDFDRLTHVTAPVPLPEGRESTANRFGKKRQSSLKRAGIIVKPCPNAIGIR